MSLLLHFTTPSSFYHSFYFYSPFLPPPQSLISLISCLYFLDIFFTNAQIYVCYLTHIFEHERSNGIDIWKPHRATSQKAFSFFVTLLLRYAYWPRFTQPIFHVRACKWLPKCFKMTSNAAMSNSANLFIFYFAFQLFLQYLSLIHI